MGTINVSLPADGETIDASDYNTPINTIVGEINGNLDNANIASDAAIAGSKLASGGVDTTQLADGAVTNAKLDDTAGAPGGVWTDFTPALTNWTLGSGTVVAKYMQLGKTVFYRMSINLGAGSAIGGAMTFNLPVDRAADYLTAGEDSAAIGTVVFNDSNSTNDVGFVVTTDGAVGTALITVGTDPIANISSTVPFTWTTGDGIQVQGFYECA